MVSFGASSRGRVLGKQRLAARARTAAPRLRSLTPAGFRTVVAAAEAMLPADAVLTPAKGVVDERLTVHGTDNVTVCDPSTFPTSTTVNPQLTVMALADYAVSLS